MDVMRARVHALIWLLLLGAIVSARQAAPGAPRQIADGVLLYRLGDETLLDPPGPIAVQALRLDPARIKLTIVQAEGKPARETVDTLARRHRGVVAAINAGFFSMESGAPVAFLKVDGKVVSGTTRSRGAVGFLERGGRTSLLFDRVSVNRSGGRVTIKPLLGSSPRDWSRARHAISGAGLLRLDGRELDEWTDERISAGFDTARHPRTMIGTDEQGAIWLVTVDGRNPSSSLGMSFRELQRLATRLGLRSALNLDGGGSTTMWVEGQVINRPSDPLGPRPVGDAILVFPR